ncbi:hypothetical protein [Citrobacter amalonaticus]|nr:hypothetical protein [Citrobacter amalonaticus]
MFTAILADKEVREEGEDELGDEGLASDEEFQSLLKSKIHAMAWILWPF